MRSGTTSLVVLVAVVAMSLVAPPRAIQAIGGLEGGSAPLAALNTPDANLTVSLSVGPTTTEPGFLVSYSCAVRGGAGGYVIVMDLGFAGGRTTENGDSAGGTTSYPDAGLFTITCTATDAASTTAAASAQVQIIARPSAVLRGSAASVRQGEEVTFTAAAQGGIGPFTFLWLNLPPGCPYGNVSSVTCTPTTAGSWMVTVTIVDALEVTETSSYTVTVRSGVPLLGLGESEATIALGIIALAASIVASIVGVLLVHRARRNPVNGSSIPESDALLKRTGGTMGPGAPSPPGSPPSRWRPLPPLKQRASLLALLAALSASFYLSLGWFAFIRELSPSVLVLVLFMWAGLITTVSSRLVGPVLSAAGLLAGVALYFAVSQPMSTCTGSPSVAQALGVPTCQDLLTAAVGAAVVVGFTGAGAGAFLVRRTRAPRSEKPFIAAGVLMIAVLIALSGVVLTTPPPAPSGAGPAALPFPIPAGSAFRVPFPYHDPAANVSYYLYTPATFVRVPASGFQPAVLVGGWNSSMSVCVYEATVSRAPILPPAGTGVFFRCGTSVTFVFPLAPAAWIVQIGLENERLGDATITITQTIELVY
jgi:hypothetical protein